LGHGDYVGMPEGEVNATGAAKIRGSRHQLF
jgi:hypothetical protein